MYYQNGMNKLKSIMDQRGIANADLAKKVGCTPAEIWRLTKWPDPKGRRMTVKWAERIAAALEIAPNDLLFNDMEAQVHEMTWRPEKEPKTRLIKVRGEAAAGRWLERDEIYDDDTPMISGVVGQFPGLLQFAYKVSGNSMNKKRICSGDFVICVPYYDARPSIQRGDIVVIERTNGHLTERTIKEVQIGEQCWELWPRSTDPNYQTPIRVPFEDGTAEDGTTIEVVGLVIGLYAPM